MAKNLNKLAAIKKLHCVVEVLDTLFSDLDPDVARASSSRGAFQSTSQTFGYSPTIGRAASARLPPRYVKRAKQCARASIAFCETQSNQTHNGLKKQDWQLIR